MTTSKKKPTTVEEYIEQAPENVREKLREMRSSLKSVSPQAEESLKWSMPAFSYERILFTYAGFKNHIGLYPTPGAIEPFKKELKEYKTGKGSIQFPLDTPLPHELIKKIAQFRIKEVKENGATWM